MSVPCLVASSESTASHIPAAVVRWDDVEEPEVSIDLKELGATLPG